MRYALLSDVHGKIGRLRQALADIQRRGAERIISLGDMGNSSAYAMLRDAGAVGVFGNWEVSGLSQLPGETHRFVSRLPAVWDEDPFLAAHAVPYTMLDPTRPGAAARQIRTRKARWGDLFPYVTESREALWHSFAHLAGRGRRILFHGHTHVQSGWRLDGDNRLHHLDGPRIPVGTQDDSADLFAIGVGSVGLPDDGDEVAYTWYDSDTGMVEWIRLPWVSYVKGTDD